MGRSVDYLDIVLTCKGDYYAPGLSQQLDQFKSKLQRLIANDKPSLVFKKVEPWNSIKVTFQIPKDAADRLRLLASSQMRLLNEMGILGVKIGEEDLYFNDTQEQCLDPILDNILKNDKNPAGSNASSQLSFLPGNVQNNTNDHPILCSQPIKRGRGAPRGPRKKRKLNPNDISSILNLNIETKKKPSKNKLTEITPNSDELPELIGNLFDYEESISGFGSNMFFDKSSKDSVSFPLIPDNDLSEFEKITQRVNQNTTNGVLNNHFCKNVESDEYFSEINFDSKSKNINTVLMHHNNLLTNDSKSMIYLNGYKESEKIENLKSSYQSTNIKEAQSINNNTEGIKFLDRTKIYNNLSKKPSNYTAISDPKQLLDQGPGPPFKFFKNHFVNSSHKNTFDKTEYNKSLKSDFLEDKKTGIDFVNGKNVSGLKLAYKTASSAAVTLQSGPMKCLQK